MLTLYSDPDGKNIFMTSLQKKKSSLRLPDVGRLKKCEHKCTESSVIGDNVAILKAKVGYLERKLEKFNQQKVLNKSYGLSLINYVVYSHQQRQQFVVTAPIKERMNILKQ